MGTLALSSSLQRSPQLSMSGSSSVTEVLTDSTKAIIVCAGGPGSAMAVYHPNYRYRERPSERSDHLFHVPLLSRYVPRNTCSTQFGILTFQASFLSASYKPSYAPREEPPLISHENTFGIYHSVHCRHNGINVGSAIRDVHCHMT